MRTHPLQHRPLAPAAAADSAPNQLSIQMQTMQTQAEGLQLVTQGTLTNKGSEPMVLTAEDIELVADGLMSQILQIDPPLPWQVPGNNNQMLFTITFQRPPAENAQLQIKDQSGAAKQSKLHSRCIKAVNETSNSPLQQLSRHAAHSRCCRASPIHQDHHKDLCVGAIEPV